MCTYVARADSRVIVEVIAVLLAICLRSKDELGRRHVELFLRHAKSISIDDKHHHQLR